MASVNLVCEVSVCHVRLHIADIDNSECLVQGHEFEFSWAGSLIAVDDAQSSQQSPPKKMLSL
eukprot:1264746-Amphidinium_carterae.1